MQLGVPAKGPRLNSRGSCRVRCEDLRDEDWCMIHEKYGSRIHRWDGTERGRSRIVHNSDTDFPVDLGSRRGGNALHLY